MPSKKKKYNARFPAGRIKKIMQTDEEVGKVAQAVPVIISRTLELFVKSLLVQATQITTARNAKTLSPSHLKQCILHEARFDFLRELVKNIPDVTAAEERELQSAENSPNSNSINSNSEAPPPPPPQAPAPAPPRPAAFAVPAPLADAPRRRPAPLPLAAPPPLKLLRTETATGAIDLSTRANFYQETLPDDDAAHGTVIRVNPSYASPQPSTSSLGSRFDSGPLTPLTPVTPLTPLINIDFTKNLANPEIRLLEPFPPVPELRRIDGARRVIPPNYTVKALSRSAKPREPPPPPVHPLNADADEDYDT